MSQSPGPFTAVAERVYVSTAPFHHPDASGEVNVGLVVGTDAALLIDTGCTPDQGRLLRAAAGAVTEAPLSSAVITHWHYDHAFGLAGIGAQTSIAHESVGGRLAGADGTAEAARLGLDPAALAAPSRAVAVAAVIDLGGGVRAEALHLGRGHTDGDLVVVVPGSDVILAGDLVESSGPPSYGPDSFPHEWPGTLEALIGLLTEQTLLIPGHGRPMDAAAAREQRARVAAVSGEITRLAGLGVTAAEAESRGEWALPFDAVRGGLPAGLEQARPTRPGRRLPLA